MLIKVEDQWKAAFKTPYSLYQLKVMFFGLTNLPATFQHMMDWVFQQLQDKYPGMIFVYMDNILIATIKDYDLHWRLVHKVLNLLEKESFFLKLAKCKFKQQSIDYLGIVVTKGTVRIDPTKQNGLVAWPQQLTSVKQVHSTLGVLGYQWLFIHGFAHLTWLIMQLLKKEKKFEWTEECTMVLNKLIKIVTSDPVLHRPNYNLPFTLEVDASQYATGAILYQPNDKGRLCPVGYHSHTLNSAERGYDVLDRELLAIMRGLHQWHHLLLSSPFKMVMIMDHTNLQYYWQPQKINWQVVQYLANLTDYNFALVHKPGRLNRADHLSWRPDYDEGKDNNEDVQVLPDVLFTQAIASLDMKQEVYNHQGKAASQIQQFFFFFFESEFLFRSAHNVVQRRSRRCLRIMFGRVSM
jgi:RNase H-like domain found in reverse transcriptase/Reverse transcriptase (RNA-dependent DNA polymerase)